MRSTILILLLVLMGSLSFQQKPEPHSLWEYRIPTNLEEDEVYGTLAPWIEYHFPYSRKEYHWEEGYPVITVDQALSAIPDESGDPLKYSYKLTIEVKDSEVLLMYSHVTPLVLQASAGLALSRRLDNGPWESIRLDLLDLSHNMERMLSLQDEHLVSGF